MADDGGAAREVLITRADGEATAQRVLALGFMPVLAPLFTVVPRVLPGAGAVDAVLVTSGNALAALAGGQALLFAVGDATAERARAAGFTAVSAGGDACDLLALVRRSCAPGAALLLATGQGQGHALAGALRRSGFRVRRRVAYATRPVSRLPDAARQALAGGRLRAALFLSAETARIFVLRLPAGLRPALIGVEALAIGQPAADVLAPLPWRRVRVSLAPTLDQVLALL